VGSKCKLCLKEGVELQRSHFIPKAAYRLLLDKTAKNRNPYLINNKSIVQTSDQLAAFLLCRDCEQMFHRKGESWFLKHCLRKNSFLFQEMLVARAPVASQPGTDVYYLAQIPEINIAALAYFASSIFWRGSIHWWDAGRPLPVKLGPYGELFRKYLKGEADFPKDAILQGAVLKGQGQYSRVITEPFGERTDTYHRFTFTMGGISFVLMVGKILPSRLREYCLVRGFGNPIISTVLLDKWTEDTAIRKITENPLLMNAIKRDRDKA
jgi:hypothetical protein